MNTQRSFSTWLAAALLLAACADSEPAEGPGAAPLGAPDGGRPTQPGTPGPDGGALMDPCDPAHADGFAELGAEGFAVSSFGSVTAPATVHLHALTTTLADVDPLRAHYAWDLGDAGSPHDALVGWNVAHVYEEPGDYCPSVTVREESGRTRRFAVHVKIVASARPQVHVAASGNDAADGVTEATAVQSLSRAKELTTSGTEILFRRGDTFVVPAGPSALFDGNLKDVRISAYGDGDRPLIQWPSKNNRSFFGLGPGAQDVLIEHLAVEQVLPRASREEQPVFGYPNGQNVTVRDIEVRAVRSFLNLEAGAPPGPDRSATRKLRGVLVQDNVTSNADSLTMYMVWLDGQDVVLLGNHALNSAQEHIFRGGSPHRLLSAENVIANVDRRPVHPDTGAACECPKGQTCYVSTLPAGCECRTEGGCNLFDVAKGTHVLRGTYEYVWHDTVTGGPTGAAALCTSPAVSGWPEWTVYDGVDIDGTLQLWGDHTMVRNTVLRCDGSYSCVKIAPDGEQAICAGTHPTDVNVAHDTIIRNDATGRLFQIAGQVTDVHVSANLGVAPALTCGQTDAELVRTGGMPEAWSFAHDVWPMTAAADACFHPGNAYALPTWEELPNVDDERAQAVTVDADARPAAAVRVPRTLGVLTDRFGTPRSGGEASAGAVE